MTFSKSLLILLLILINFLFAQPTFADEPKFLKNSDYLEVTKALNTLSLAKETQTEGYKPEKIQQKIDELEFQKNILETGLNWGQCSNQTGRTLAVYGPQPDFDDDDYEYTYKNALYFLANGQTTKQQWDCDGVYLPNDIKTVVTNSKGKTQDLSGPIVIEIADGTQLIVKTNPDTSAVEFNIPPTKIVQADDAKWFIPNVSQAIVDTRVTNAPAVRIAAASGLVRGEIKPTVVESNPATQTKPQPQSQPTLPRTGFYRR